MRIGKVTGYIAAGLLSSTCSLKTPTSEKALEHASKYLKGYEFVVEKDRAYKISSSNFVNHSKDIFYWDSLLSVNREKEFKQKGIQHIKDSLNGSYNRKPIFSMSVEPRITQNGEQIIDSIKREVAKYYTGEEILKLERKAPNKSMSDKWGTNENQVTHYLGELAIKGAERKGFSDGLQEGRKLLKQNKLK